ncbi:hypothetical protein RE442_30590, partial [Pseudomonas aeruginosa]
SAGSILTGGLNRAAGENVGVYGINQGDLALNSGNYFKMLTCLQYSIFKMLTCLQYSIFKMLTCLQYSIFKMFFL